MEYLYCINNRKLKTIEMEKIDFPWWKRYIGRSIIPEAYYELFDHNGYYPYVEQYEDEDIILNLKPTLDETKRISGIGYYKMRQASFGHGRVNFDDERVLKADIAVFQEVLDSVTVDRIPAEYEILCKKLLQAGELPGGYTVKAVSEAGVDLLDQVGKKHRLAKKKIVCGLELSHFYLDVLYAEKTLLDNPKYFSAKDVPLYLAVFSQADYTEYDRLTELKGEAGLRKATLAVGVEEGDQKLIDAVAADDLAIAEQYAHYAPFEFPFEQRIERQPLLNAVSKGNYKMVELLLKNGACSTQSVKGDNSYSYYVSPMHVAVEMKNYPIVELLARYGGAESHTEDEARATGFTGLFHIDSTYKLIRKTNDVQALAAIMRGADRPLRLPPFKFEGMDVSTDELITSLAPIKKAPIVWPVSCIREALSRSRELCISMLEQGSEYRTIHYLIELGDFELFQICLKKHNYNTIPKGYHYDKALTAVLDHDLKWFHALQTSFGDGANGVRTAFLSRLYHNKCYEEFISYCIEAGRIVPISVFCDLDSSVPFDDTIDHFIDSIINYFEYQEDLMDDGYSYQTWDREFWHFSDMIYRCASEKTCKHLLSRYYITFSVSKERFLTIMQELERSDELFLFALNVKKEHLQRTTLPEYDIYELFNRYASAASSDEPEQQPPAEQKVYDNNIKYMKMILSVFPLMASDYAATIYGPYHGKKMQTLIEENGLTEVLFKE